MGEAAKHENLPANLRAGMLIADKYRLVEPRGEGAMGAVWGAEHVTLGNNVAIKFLHRSVAASPEARARFDREAKVAARLGEASRHITRVMDHGVTGDGTPFLVMELLQGEGLEVMLKRERRVPISLAAKITSQLCKALNVAHQAGVIHRDLKPANVFLTHSADDADVCVKLLDFGVAKAAIGEVDEDQDTRTGALVGTPNYMSPEQITGDRELDPRSDLWAVAAIAYRMAAGRAPFGSGALNELAMRITSSEPPTPSTLAPDLPPEFDVWVHKGLAKKPEDRYQTAKELADSIAIVAGVSNVGTTTGTFPSIASDYIALQSGDSVGGLQVTDWGRRSAIASATVPPKRRSSLTVPIVALMLVAGAAGGFLFLKNRASAQGGSPPPTTATAPAGSTPAPTASTPATAPPTTSASAAPSVVEATPSASASTPPTAAPTAIAPRPGVAITSTATTTASAAASASAAPPPPDPKQTGGDLWKKTDEM